jgi:tRNA-specific 2-thiouridylase
LQKATVRNLARQAGFITATKKDSTGLCFIGERPFKEFLARFLPKQPGPIETPEGQLLGQHEGLMYYTIGQRQGLNIGGRSDGNGQAWYVVAKDQTRNTLIVAQGHEHPLLFSQKIHAAQLHWIAETPPPMPYACQAKVRYRQADQPCTITVIEGATCHIDFEQPQRAVTPGQSIVFYQKEICLGGAIITTITNP